jgi:SAM-dependent methyltransferase
VDFEFMRGRRDLSDPEIEATQLSYALGAEPFSFFFERKKGALEKALKDTLNPFFEIIHQLFPDISNEQIDVLFAGCGTARDLEHAMETGYSVYGIDSSEKMIELAARALYVANLLKDQLPLEVMNILVMSLEKRFTALFCESAGSHIKKSDMPQVLNDFADNLVEGGVALLGFRGSQTGEVYRTQDPVGIRYNTSYTQAELDDLLAKSRFQVLKVTTAAHQVATRPGFINYFVRRGK